MKIITFAHDVHEHRFQKQQPSMKQKYSTLIWSGGLLPLPGKARRTTIARRIPGTPGTLEPNEAGNGDGDAAARASGSGVEVDNGGLHARQQRVMKVVARASPAVRSSATHTRPPTRHAENKARHVQVLL